MSNEKITIGDKFRDSDGALYIVVDYYPHTRPHKCFMCDMYYIEKNSNIVASESDLLAMERISNNDAQPVIYAANWHDLEFLFANINQWQAETFPSATPQSIANHLLEEAKELQENPTDASEFADVAILVAGLGVALGTNPVDAIREKFQINKKREWGEPETDGVVHHKKENDDE